MDEKQNNNIIDEAAEYVAFLRLNRRNLPIRMARGAHADTVFEREDEKKVFLAMVRPTSIGHLLKKTCWAKIAQNKFGGKLTWKELKSRCQQLVTPCRENLFWQLMMGVDNDLYAGVDVNSVHYGDFQTLLKSIRAQVLGMHEKAFEPEIIDLVSLDEE